MKQILPTLLISWWLALWSTKTLWADQIGFLWETDYIKERVWEVLQSEVLFEQDQFEALFHKKLDEIWWLNEEQKQVIREMISQPNFKKEFFEILKREKSWSLENIVISLILWFLYWYAYHSTIRKVRKQYMPIDTKSFWIFSLTSGWMVLLNGFIPWSLVYFESFLLASFTVYSHYYNTKHGKVYQNPFFNEFIEENPLPIVKYDKNGQPTIWNNKMVEETWFTHQEVIDYYKKHEEVMSLFYKGEDMEKVQQYLEKIEKTWKWYKNVTFTMTIKSWEKKTFLWTTIPDGQWGTMRTARPLMNEWEIEKELKATQELLKRDFLTWAYNKQAFEEDFEKLFHCHGREKDKKEYVIVILDIDNFKWVNDIHWHTHWDHILQEFSRIVFSRIRKEDGVYRVGWDEFILLFPSNKLEWIVHKVNEIKNIFYQEFQLWISCGMKPFQVDTQDNTKWNNEEKKEQIKTQIKNIKDEVDYYMYSVKYLKLIHDELQKRGVLETSITEKNALAYPSYDENWVFNGVHVLWIHWEIFVLKEELDLIVERKKWKKDQIGKRER